MKLISRYPVRFTLPLLLLVFALLGSSAIYLFNSTSIATLIEEQAVDKIGETMGRYQYRLNDALQDRDKERLRKEIYFLVHTAKIQGTTLVIDEKQRILDASNPAWQGQPLMKADISVEGKEVIKAFLHAKDRKPQGAVILSRDRQTIYAVFPLLFGENPARMGLLFHKYDLQGIKQAKQQKLRGRMFLVFFLFAVASFLLWLYFYFVFFRRVLLIVKTMERFTHGNDTARSALAGDDELAEISTALDGMLDQRVAAENQRREQQRLLKLLTDGLPLLIAYVDKEERYRLVNQEFENWFYLKPEQVVGRQVRDLMGEQGYNEIADHVRQVLDGKVVEYESAMPIAHDGMRQVHATMLPHFENGSGVQGYFLLAQDITQQRKDQSQIRKAQEQWECTFDSIRDEIITVQDKDFRILQANSAATIFFGIPREEIVGRHCYELFREDNNPCVECPAYAVLQEGRTHSVELYHERLKKHFLVTISPMMNEKGEFFGVVHSAKDITKFKQLEQQLRQGPEDGGHRYPGRRHSPRFQQYSHPDPRLQRTDC